MQQDHLEALIHSYSLSPATQLAEEYKAGLSNNYAIESDGVKYFVKQYRHADLEKVREIHLVKHYFAAGGIPIVLPLPTASGETITVIDSIMYALFPYVQGKHPEEGKSSEAALTSLATMLARIHQVSLTNPLVISDHSKEWNPEGFLEKAGKILEALKNKTDRTELDDQMEQCVLLKRTLVQSNIKVLADFNLPNTTLTHGDYHAYNVFFNDNDEVIWVFDLEKAEMAPRACELVRSMDFLTLNGNFSDENIKRAQHYISEYHRQYPLLREELRSAIEVRFIKEFHSLWIEGEHYLYDNHRFDRFFAGGFSTLQYLSKNLPGFIEELTSVI